MDETLAKLRKQARERTMVLPGTGFALLGYPRLALAGYAVTLLMTAAIVAACFRPETPLLWTAAVTFGFLCGFVVFEYVAVSRWEVRSTGGPSAKSGQKVWIYVLATLLGVVIGGCLLVNFRAFIMAGSGMAPRLLDGERVIYHKRVDPASLVRGGVVSFELSKDSAWGGPGIIVIARVLAIPGDSLSKRQGHYLVNGQEGPEVSPIERAPAPLEIPEAPESVVVPPDRFFVVQENPAKSLDSQTFSWVKRANLISTRHWLVSARGFFRPIE